MPSPSRTVNLLILLALAAALAGANIWFAAERSLIPVAVDGRVVAKETRREKHPGKDDVYLLQLAPGGEVQVDQIVYEAVDEGDWLNKTSFAGRLSIDGRPLRLEWSRDFYGMLLAMPLVLLVLGGTSTCVWWLTREASTEG